MNRFFLTAVLIVCAGLQTSFAQSVFDTITIHFDINKYEIDDSNRISLDALVKRYQSSDHKMLIYGYADYLGTPRPNDTLSDRRAHAVKDYLSTHGISVDRFIQVTGVGQVSVRDDIQSIGNQKYRRADILVRLAKYNEYTYQAPKVIADPAPIIPQVPAKRDWTTVSINETIVLENIQFYKSKSHIMPQSLPALDSLVDILERYPSMKIVLEGHICCLKIDSDGFDYVTNDYHLSRNRAKLIYDYLVQHGIKAARLDYIGYANKKPLVYPEITEYDAQQNRRVEARIIAR